MNGIIKIIYTERVFNGIYVKLPLFVVFYYVCFQSQPS